MQREGKMSSSTERVSIRKVLKLVLAKLGGEGRKAMVEY